MYVSFTQINFSLSCHLRFYQGKTPAHENLENALQNVLERCHGSIEIAAQRRS